MASGLVDAVVGKLGGMLIQEINKEVSLVCNFRNDYEWLSKELTNIRGYLTDAEYAQDASVKRWLLDVADIAWDAEDMLEECALQSQGATNEFHQSSCVCAYSCSQLVFRYKMARRIKDVRDRMRSVMEGAVKLKLVADLTHPEQPSTSTSRNAAKWRASNVIESGSRPVAIESKVEDVLRLLEDPASPVIAVVGMGGVGKTFLLKNAFDKAQSRFEKSVWLAISQTYSLQKLQAALACKIDLKEVVEGRVDEVQAAQLIQERLRSTQGGFLIVLDDVWRATGEDNFNLISALGLPTGKTAHCKIVVTTRSRDVCRNMNARVYELHPLLQEESWELFCAYAFQGNEPPHHVEGLARQIEGECGRLPLAVKTVAASLAGKTSREWESKLRQLKAVSYKEDPIMQILKLSFDSLPRHLKPCFAYLCFFPEDEEIDSQYVINLWVAEGYIPEGEDQDQLDIGWNYLCHLHSLCLVERVDFDAGSVLYHKLERRIKLHDLLLDLAISIAKESQWTLSVGESFKKAPTVQTSSSYRRILMGNKSIGDADVDTIASNRAYSASRLRTLCLSPNEGIHNIPPILLSGARVLRVLDLSRTNISSLPDCIGNLKLLRVLNLSETEITEVPECVKRLNKSLRFLDISFCRNLQQYPNWIGDLSCLGYLDIRPVNSALTGQIKFDGSMPKEISKLVCLQVLKIDGDNKLSDEENEFLKLDHFVNLVNLRELRLYIRHEAELKSIEDGILTSLVKMRELTMYNHVDNTGNFPPLSEKMLDMKYLEYLFLCRFAVPNWLWRFSDLTRLLLYHCQSEYPALETMPNLMHLELNRNDICEALPKGFGKSGGFPKLLVFKISFFPALRELVTVEDGAMPHLEVLHVYFCPTLKKVPPGLKFLKSLKRCRFKATGVDMHDENTRNLKIGIEFS